MIATVFIGFLFVGLLCVAALLFLNVDNDDDDDFMMGLV